MSRGLEPMEDHAHDWVPHLPDAEGVYSKRDCPGDSFRCRGRVMRCAGQPCDTYLFVPHNQTWRPVEAVAA